MLGTYIESDPTIWGGTLFGTVSSLIWTTRCLAAFRMGASRLRRQTKIPDRKRESLPTCLIAEKANPRGAPGLSWPAILIEKPSLASLNCVGDCALILKKGPRALICAYFFCLPGVACRVAEAAEVYPGCAVPSTTFEHTWYVDPVSGKTQADGGDGSKARPWNSLNAIVSSTNQPGYTRPLLSSIPYFHRQPLPATTQRIYADQTGAVVEPGDEILLMDGQYGDISIGVNSIRTTNSAFVTIAAAPGQHPVLASLGLSATNMWRFQHLSVQSIGKNQVIRVSDQGPLTTSDIIFESIIVGSPESVDNWTQAQWIANAHGAGFWEVSSAGGLNTKCVSFTGGEIYGVRFGASLFAHKSVFSNNTIDHFGDDGLDYGANDLIISGNYVHDNEDVGDGNHNDCMQGFSGSIDKTTAPKNPNGVAYAAYSNITIKDNRCIRQTDPNLKFPIYLQGIDAFDADWTNLSVINNVVVTSSCWGVGYGSLHGGKIVNNTVLDDGSNVGTKNRGGGIMCHPALIVGDKTHQGLPSNDVIVRNNIAGGIFVDPRMTRDHNICLAIEGDCRWKPGEYRDGNMVDARGAEGEFVTFDPAKLVFDLRLKAGARAIGAGNPDGAPPADIRGAARGNPVDAGAYRYDAGK